MRLLLLRWWRRLPLFVPLVKLLCLLLLLLRRPLLHGRSRPDQRMRLLRRIELAILRFCRTIWLFGPTFLRRPAIFLRRSSLLFVDSRLRLEHWLHQSVVVFVFPVLLPEGSKTLVIRLSRLLPFTLLPFILRPRILHPLILIHRSRPRRTDRTDQSLLIQVPASFRLPLLNRAWHRWRRPYGNHGPSDHGSRRFRSNRTPSTHHACTHWFRGDDVIHWSGR